MGEPSRRRWAWAMLLLSVLGSVWASLAVGEGDLADPEIGRTFLWLRVWRLCNAALAGGTLAVGGVLVQGLFRNPLASPSILGTTAGASLGGVAVLLLWNTTLVAGVPAFLPTEMWLPLGCLLGAWSSLLVLLAITGRKPSTVTVLLSGFILTSLFLSVAGLLTSLAQETFELGRAVVAFTLGGVDAKGPGHVALALPLTVGGLLAAWSWSSDLDVLLLGEEEASSLGADIESVRRWVIVWTASLTAVAVAIGGNVAFVGLVVPHALRPFIGFEHRRLLPAAFVGGAAFVAWADVLTRVMPARGQVPLGVVTGLVGAPVFLWLLAKAGREGRVA